MSAQVGFVLGFISPALPLHPYRLSEWGECLKVLVKLASTAAHLSTLASQCVHVLYTYLLVNGW